MVQLFYRITIQDVLLVYDGRICVWMGYTNLTDFCSDHILILFQA